MDQSDHQYAMNARKPIRQMISMIAVILISLIDTSEPKAGPGEEASPVDRCTTKISRRRGGKRAGSARRSGQDRAPPRECRSSTDRSRGVRGWLAQPVPMQVVERSPVTCPGAALDVVEKAVVDPGRLADGDHSAEINLRSSLSNGQRRSEAMDG